MLKKLLLLAKEEDITFEIESDTTLVNDTDSAESSQQAQAILNFDLDQESPVLNFELEEESSEESPLDFPVINDDIQQEETAYLTNDGVDNETDLNNDDVVVHTLEMDDETPEQVISDLKDEAEKEEFTQINHGISAEQMAIRSRQRMERLREIPRKATYSFRLNGFRK